MDNRAVAVYGVKVKGAEGRAGMAAIHGTYSSSDLRHLSIIVILRVLTQDMVLIHVVLVCTYTLRASMSHASQLKYIQLGHCSFD